MTAVFVRCALQNDPYIVHKRREPVCSWPLSTTYLPS